LRWREDEGAAGASATTISRLLLLCRCVTRRAARCCLPGQKCFFSCSRAGWHYYTLHLLFATHLPSILFSLFLYSHCASPCLKLPSSPFFVRCSKRSVMQSGADAACAGQAPSSLFSSPAAATARISERCRLQVPAFLPCVTWRAGYPYSNCFVGHGSLPLLRRCLHRLLSPNCRTRCLQRARWRGATALCYLPLARGRAGDASSDRQDDVCWKALRCRIFYYRTSFCSARGRAVAREDGVRARFGLGDILLLHAEAGRGTALPGAPRWGMGWEADWTRCCCFERKEQHAFCACRASKH